MSSTTSAADPFAGLAEQWRQVTAWVAASASLPTTQAAFTTRYGAFDDTAEVGRFTESVASVAALAPSVGGPAALKQALLATPDLLSGDAPPSALYDRLVWLATRVGSAAENAASTFSQVPTLLDPANGDTAARAEGLKAILAGPGGLVEGFNRVRAPAEALVTALHALAGTANPLARHLAATALINQANVAIGGLESENRRLAAQPPDKPGLFSWGSDKTPDPAPQIAANNQEIARKQALIDDSAALLAASERVGGALSAIVAAVEALALRFQRAANQLVQFCAISTAEQLGDAAWVAKALDPAALVADWQPLGQAARGFVQSAMLEVPA
jgi:hypothetical protein